MKKSFQKVCLIFSIALVACSNNVKKEQKIPAHEPQEHYLVQGDIPYFKATGTEPFWALKITQNKITLQTQQDTLNFPHTAPIKAMDANVKRYNIETKATLFTITIAMQKCTNAMSGEEFPYSVKVEQKTKDATTTLEGCGNYRTDYRLHDIWLLEKINGEKVSKADFGKEIPMIEINTNSNLFSGNDGCNRITGKLFYELETLRFTNIITTEMACLKNGLTTEFVNALKSSTAYTIANNRLALRNSDTETLVFKKID